MTFPATTAPTHWQCSLFTLLTAILFMFGTATTTWAKDKNKKERASVGKFHHEGTVVSAKEGELTMTVAGGLPHTHPVAPKAKVTLDGKSAKLEDLRRGDKVQVLSQVKVTPHPVSGRPVLSIEGAALEIQATRPKKPERNKEPNNTASAKDRDVALGVAVAASPAGSPLVVNVAKDSPAEAAGIKQGDYITSVDKADLDSPEALQKAIDKNQPGDSATLGVWRNGQQLSLKVKFPKSNAEESQKLAGRPWLGLMLGAPSDKPGAVVARVYLRGPAAKAGILPGDRIIEINGQSVESPRQAAQQVRNLEPGAKTEIAVVRDGDEERFTIQIGNLGDFHERLFGEDFRTRFDDFHTLFDPDFDGVPERFELLKPRLPRDTR